ncbi:uncharacterized protein LOC127251587 isoform X2 [Andrographis paniculata]|uniref:uncharacterized protein LOC127251587 isoform X2 n=1 Tax=Andrographis paniculata TaxID=175694 RepID=UPI0021E76E3D|nr:uncharacterized protein LOC127251587 isoform X2 [Andrographis paniculata]
MADLNITHIYYCFERSEEPYQTVFDLHSFVELRKLLFFPVCGRNSSKLYCTQPRKFQSLTPMAPTLSTQPIIIDYPFSPANPNFKFNNSRHSVRFPKGRYSSTSSTVTECMLRRRLVVCSNQREDTAQSSSEEAGVDNLGVKTALSMLRFYKREGRFHHCCQIVVDTSQHAASTR